MHHASNPLRLTHTCKFPCMKTISKTKEFLFSSHGSLIGHTSIIMLDHPPIFFIGHTPKILWTTLRKFYGQHSKNIVDNPQIFSLDILRKHCGQPSDIFIGHTPKILWTTLRKYCGQPPDIFIGQHSKNTMDNTPKILWTTLRYFHWRYSENMVDNPSIFSLDILQ